MGDQESREAGGGTGFGWRKLLAYASLGAALVILLATLLIFKSADPPFIVMFLLFSIGGALALRSGRTGVTGRVLASLAALMFTVMGAGFVFSLLQTPETPELIPVTTTLLFSLAVLLSAIVLAIKGRGRAFEPSNAAKAVGGVTLALIAAIAAWNIYLSATYESEAAQPGDIAVVTRDFEFHPDSFSTEPGSVTVHVTNRDDTLHTFTIERLGVDISVPPGKSARATFQAPAGEYRFICRPHEQEMAGELSVA